MGPGEEPWSGELGEWWLGELRSDPAYEEEVTPLVLDLASPRGRVLDVGCGEGRLLESMRRLGCSPIGVDISPSLLHAAAEKAPVVLMDLPSLGCFKDAVFDGAVVSLVMEHLADHRTMLSELARVIVPGGFLALVVNHPIYTAPDSAPIEEPDGEVLWRPGTYLQRGHTDEPVAGDSFVRFYHRPLGLLLTDASESGWDLERMFEGGVTPSQIDRHPPLAKQRHIPRLLGVRWIRR